MSVPWLTNMVRQQGFGTVSVCVCVPFGISASLNVPVIIWLPVSVSFVLPNGLRKLRSPIEATLPSRCTRETPQ